jgi:hypothetical protein
MKFHDFLEMVVEIFVLLLKSCKDSVDSSEKILVWKNNLFL